MADASALEFVMLLIAGSVGVGIALGLWETDLNGGLRCRGRLLGCGAAPGRDSKRRAGETPGAARGRGPTKRGPL